MTNDSKVSERVDDNLRQATQHVRRVLREEGLLTQQCADRLHGSALTALVRRVFSQLTYTSGKVNELYGERRVLGDKRGEVVRDHNFLCNLEWWTDDRKWPLPLQRIAEKYSYPLPQSDRTETLRKNVISWLKNRLEEIDSKVGRINGEITRLEKELSPRA